MTRKPAKSLLGSGLPDGSSGSIKLLTIIGCGNPNRSDDGAGVYVAKMLQKYLVENPCNNVRVFDAGTSGMEVMFQARGSSALIIVDANSSGSKPGDIFEVPGEVLANIPDTTSHSLHGFRWDNAIYAGHKIFKQEFPKEIQVYLIEAESLGLGLELSGIVQAAACKVVAKIIVKIEQMSSALELMSSEQGSSEQNSSAGQNSSQHVDSQQNESLARGDR
jgi:hydrogenase maturation protease